MATKTEVKPAQPAPAEAAPRLRWKGPGVLHCATPSRLRVIPPLGELPIDHKLGPDRIAELRALGQLVEVTGPPWAERLERPTPEDVENALEKEAHINEGFTLSPFGGGRLI